MFSVAYLEELYEERQLVGTGGFGCVFAGIDGLPVSLFFSVVTLVFVHSYK